MIEVEKLGIEKEKFDIKFISYTAQELKLMTIELCRKIRSDDYNPSCLIGLGRGGWPVLRYCSDFLNVDKTYSMRIKFYTDIKKTKKKPIVEQPLPSSLNLTRDRVLLLDDIADTGGTLDIARRYIQNKYTQSDLKIGTLVKKPWSKQKPDYFATEKDAWINFDWEKCETCRRLLEKHKLEKELTPKQIREVFTEIGLSEENIDVLFEEKGWLTFHAKSFPPQNI